MPSPCDTGEWPTCVPGNLVEIVLSDFPAGWVDGNDLAPPGSTNLGHSLLWAFYGHAPNLAVPMPGGWHEEVAVGSTYVQARPPDPDTGANPHLWWLVVCDVAGYGVAMNYPRPPGELAALWTGSLTTIPLLGGGTCKSTVVGPYAAAEAPLHEPGKML